MVRLSLRELLIVVAMIAVAIPSLKYASEAWLAIVLTGAMIAIFIALITAAVDRGERQAFALGFAIVMGVYGLILMSVRSREFDHREGRLPTTLALRYLHAAVDRSVWTPDVSVLQMGTNSELVAVVQRILNKRLSPSPNLEVDGEFGPLTDRAVRSFQANAGLPENGIVDLATWKALGMEIDARAFKVTFPEYAQPRQVRISIGNGMGGFSGGTLTGPVIGGGTYTELPPRKVFVPIGHCWWAVLLGYAGGHFARFIYGRRVRDTHKQPAEAT